MNSQPLFIPKTQTSTPATGNFFSPSEPIFNTAKSIVAPFAERANSVVQSVKQGSFTPLINSMKAQGAQLAQKDPSTGGVLPMWLSSAASGGLAAPEKGIASAIAKNLPKGGMIMDAARKFEGKPVFDINTDSLIRSDRTGQKELDPAKVQAYRDMIKQGKPTDPIRVDAYDGGLFTEDGKHRLAAHIAENQPFISAIDGTLKSTPRFIKTKTGAFAGSTKK